MAKKHGESVSQPKLLDSHSRPYIMESVITSNFLTLFRDLSFEVEEPQTVGATGPPTRLYLMGQQVLDALRESKAHDNNPHHEETLFEHLVSVAEFTHSYGLDKGWVTPTSPWVFYLCGFLHDIGKMGAHRPIYGGGASKCRKYGTKGHSVIGASMLECWLLNEDMKRRFSLSDRDVVSLIMTTNYHMCPYHSTSDDELNKSTTDPGRLACLANALNNDAIHLMMALRYGDENGRRPKDAAEESRNVERQAKYETDLNWNFENRPNLFRLMAKIKSEEGKTTAISRALLINVTDQSGSGKTTFCNSLLKWMNDVMGLVEGRDVFHLQRNKFIEDVVNRSGYTPSQPSSSSVDPTYYEIYKQHRDELSPRVNKTMNARVCEILAAERVCVLETVALLGHNTRRSLLCGVENSDAIRVDVHCVRYPDTFTEEETRVRPGVSVEDQRKINTLSDQGRSWADPLGTKLLWKELASQMEDYDRRVLFSSRGDSPYRSHFVLPPIAHLVGTTPTAISGSPARDAAGTLLRNLLVGRSDALLSPKLPPMVYESIDTPLHTVVDQLLNWCGHDSCEKALNAMTRFFVSNGFQCTVKKYDTANGESSLRYTVCIKYLDGKNQMWKPLWAREARGAGFLLVPAESQDVAYRFEVMVLKRTLQRCAELLTHTHSNAGVSASQDMTGVRDSSFLDTQQQMMVGMFNKTPREKVSPNNELFVTEKVDGCLLLVTVVPRTNPLYKELSLIIAGRPPFWCGKTDAFIVIPSTSGSVEVAGKMRQTLITSSLPLFSEEVCRPPKKEEDPDEYWLNHLRDPFTQKMADALGSRTAVTTSVFEMVCADRRCYDGYRHRELATAYNHSALYILGRFVDKIYTPSHNMSGTNLSSLAFSQPLTYKVQTPQEAISLLTTLSREISQASEEQLRKFHPEGYIVSLHSKEKGFEMACKLKTPEFYQAHSVDYLLRKFSDQQQQQQQQRHVGGGVKRKSTTTTKERTLESTSSDVDREINLLPDTQTINNTFPEVARYRFITTELAVVFPNFFRHVIDEEVLPWARTNRLKNTVVDSNLDKDTEKVARYLLAKHSSALALHVAFTNFFRPKYVGELCSDSSTIATAVSKACLSRYNKLKFPHHALIPLFQ